MTKSQRVFGEYGQAYMKLLDERSNMLRGAQKACQTFPAFQRLYGDRTKVMTLTESLPCMADERTGLEKFGVEMAKNTVEELGRERRGHGCRDTSWVR
jgi:hypothetical protein